MRIAEAAEFPNDNPKLHRGAVWCCLSPRGPARAVMRWSPSPEPVQEEPADGFEQLLLAICRVAEDAGASQAAAVLPDLLRAKPIAVRSLEPDLLARLTAADIARAENDRLVPQPGFCDTALSWQKLLTGQASDKLSQLTTTLDQWSAELLATALGPTGPKTTGLRRDLRKLGVFAFGMSARGM